MSTDQVLITLAADVRDVKADVGGLKADVGGLKADVGGLKADVGGLKADVGGLKADVRDLKETAAADRAHNSRMFDQMLKSQSELFVLINQIQVSTTSLASAVGLAMTELAIARGLERRVDRLEAAVFPSKH
jgi:outer membrane murein-binding lipoprotein Lpp